MLKQNKKKEEKKPKNMKLLSMQKEKLIFCLWLIRS